MLWENPTWITANPVVLQTFVKRKIANKKLWIRKILWKNSWCKHIKILSWLLLEVINRTYNVKRSNPKYCLWSDSQGSDYKQEIRKKSFIVISLIVDTCLFCQFYQLLWADTSRPIIWNKNLRSLCVSAGWMYNLKLHLAYLPNFFPFESEY